MNRDILTCGETLLLGTDPDPLILGVDLYPMLHHRGIKDCLYKIGPGGHVLRDGKRALSLILQCSREDGEWYLHFACPVGVHINEFPVGYFQRVVCLRPPLFDEVVLPERYLHVLPCSVVCLVGLYHAHDPVDHELTRS